jgi:cytochrome d ubiquinol oxidase subunit I
MKTSEAVSPVSALQVWTTLIGFLIVYGLLGTAGFYLMYKKAKAGP